MGTLAGLPTLNPKIDNETKEFITTLDSISGHGFAKIVTVTDGEDFIKKYSDRTRKESRPEWLNGIKKVTMQVINVGHDYNKMIKNQLAKSKGGNPDDFDPEACRYSHKFSENGLVRQNNKDELAFYFRYFVGVAIDTNGKRLTTYEEVFINEQGDTVQIDQAIKTKWFNAKGGSVKQMVAGVTKEIKPRNVRMDNLYYFQRGDSIENRLTPEIMELLDLEYVS